MTRSGIVTFLSFFAYVLAQVLVLKSLVLFNTAFCFLYIFFILLLPLEFSNLLLMLIGFVLGFSIDIFYDSLGLHASSLVLLAYLRNYWLSAITPQGGYDVGVTPSLSAYGLQWFLVYTIPLIFVHHFVVFFVEAAGFHLFWYTMLKVMMSLLFTLTVALILQYLSLDRRR
ncbi:MAG: Rod shape-determining protein MreD [Flammeovirgaceae bacterium]